jgi:hypothetical protein
MALYTVQGILRLPIEVRVVNIDGGVKCHCSCHSISAFVQDDVNLANSFEHPYSRGTDVLILAILRGKNEFVPQMAKLVLDSSGNVCWASNLEVASRIRIDTS